MKLAQIHFTKILKVLAIGLVFFGISLVIFHSKTNAVAGINRTINFQGKLVNNPAKTNVTNTMYSVVFTIYDRDSGGTALWSETQTVTTADGVFRVALGSVNPIPENFNFNWDGLYLGIKVETDSEMTPRVRFTAVPYAFNAQKVSGLTVQDTAGNASTSGTLRIPNAETINFGNNSLTYTTSADTTLTLPTTGTLATLAGSEEFTNKTIGSTGLIFSGAATDITTAANESLTISPNGSGNIILAGDFDSGITVGADGGIEFPLLVRLGIGSRAAFAVDQLNTGDLITASASGATKFVVENDGDVKITAGQSIDTYSAGAFNLANTNATSAVLGSNALDTFTVTTNSTGDSEVALPAQSIGASEIVDDAIDFTKLASAQTLDENTTLSFSTLNYILDLTSTGEFYVRDSGNNFAQFLADGTITLGKVAAAGTLNLGIGTGADTINIGSDNTTGDTITIGNKNASNSLSLFGGDYNDWYIEATGSAKFNSILGAGLIDCDASTSKLLWNDATGTFSCGTDMGSNLQVQSFSDATGETATFTVVMDIWDGTYPNITPGSTTSNILVSVNIRGVSEDANDHNPVFTIRRAIGANPVCTDTQVGGEFVGGFLTTNTQDWGASVTFSDAPSSTGNVRYTVCTTTTGLDDATTSEVRVVLTEIGSSSGGGSGGVSVRESDSSPSVATASTIEFGPATTSSDEFIVSDQGGGVARVRIGDQVGLLNEAEIVTGGWTFNTTDTVFTTGILTNGGLNTTSNTDLNLAVNGTGDIAFGTDSDSGVLIGTSPTVAPLSVRGGYGSNAAFILDQLNSGDVFAASSSGTTVFRIDNSGNIIASGDLTVTGGDLTIGSSVAFIDTAGNLQLSNVDSLDATTETTIETAIDTLSNLTSAASLGSIGDNNLANLTFNVDTAGYFIFQKEGTAFTCSGTDKLTLNGSGQLVCGTDVGTGIANLWQQNLGALINGNLTQDLLLGGIATTSSKFAVLNITHATNTPVASISAQNAGGQALYLDSAGSIQTTRNNTLTLGGATTGDIFLVDNTSITGNLSVSGTTFTAGNATTVTLGSSGTDTINLGNGGADTINIGNSAADSTITIGNLSATNISITDNNWSIGVGGAASFTGLTLSSGSFNNCTAITTNGTGVAGCNTSTLQTGTEYFTSADTKTVTLINNTMDLLLGGQATISAKFGILNMANSNAPIASLSATTASGGNGSGLVLDSGSSSLQSLRKNTLTLGGNTTGNIQFNPGGLTNPSFFLGSNGDIGMGTNNTNLLASLDIRANTAGGSGGTRAIASISGATSFAGLIVDQSGAGDIFSASHSGRSIFTINQDAVQIGTGSAGAFNPVLLKLDKKINGGDPTNGTNGSMYYNESSGKFRCYENGAWTDCVGSNSVTVTPFTSSGTWTKSNYAGLKFTQVITTAGGGGGGGADGDGGNEGAAGGGGAGGTAIETLSASVLGDTVTVTVDTAGGGGGAAAGGGTGTAGGNSSFGAHNSATGGSGGVGVNSTGTCLAADIGQGGLGQGATGGDVNLTGGDGDNPGTCLAEQVEAGSGGSSYWGGGGRGGFSEAANAATVGQNGSAYGSGGGGAADEDNTTGAAGGAGVDGIVVTMNFKSSAGDLAEWYDTQDGVEMGDVVAVSDESMSYDAKLGLQTTSVLKKATKGDSVVGVISSVPNDTIGGDLLEGARRPRPLALAGRVPVKVTEANGKIKAGDLLTVSSTPGVAQKSTKAGAVIGKALANSNCSQELTCTVLVLVNTSYTTGSLTKLAFQEEGLGMDKINGDINVDRDISLALLAHMMQEKKEIVNDENVSEIYTDRIAAGLELITPRVVTDEVLVNKVKSASDEIAIVLDDNQLLRIEDSSGSAGIVFDGAGNGEFSGKLTAIEIEASTMVVDSLFVNKLKAGEIEGLVSIEGRLGELEAKVSSLSASQNIHKVEIEYATDSAKATLEEAKTELQNKIMENLLTELNSATQSSTKTQDANVDLGLDSESPSVTGNLRVKGNGLFEGVLNVIDTLITNNLILNGLATFFGEVVFKDQVAFEGPVTFSTDAGGSAVIQKDDKRVDVVFDKEFEFEPIVNASVVFDEVKDEEGKTTPTKILEEEYFNEKYSYIIVNKSKKGFTIVLNKEAKENVGFTWTAINIKDSKSFQSRLSE